MAVALIPSSEAAYVLEGVPKPLVWLRLFGQMELLTAGGASVLPPGRKTRALLAIVALSRPLPVLRVRLAGLLWSRRTEAQARASVRQELHRLATALAPVGKPLLRVTRDQVAVRPELVAIDVAELLAAKPEQDIVSSWPGSRLLDGMDGVDPAFDAWLARNRERVGADLRALAEARLSREADPDKAIRLAERLLAIDRTHEGAWRALMRAYAAQGERGLAIRAYERCRDALAVGVRAVPSVETERVLSEIRGSRAAASGVASHCPGPRLGVTPFRSVGTIDPELASAVGDEIQLALARCGSFAVVGTGAPAPSEHGPTGTAHQEALGGVDLLLSGTLQRANGRLRLLLRLLDVREGHHVVWTHRFDRPSEQALAFQESAAAATAAELDVFVWRLEAERAALALPEDAPVSNLTGRAVALMLRLEPHPFARAGSLLREALVRAPECATACAWYALWHVLLRVQYWATDETRPLPAMGLAERALVLDPASARGLAISGLVRDAIEREPRRALARLDRALALNRNSAFAWAVSGLAYAHCGELDEAARRLDHYKELVPFHPLAFFLDAGAVLLGLLRGDYERAVTLGRHASEIYPNSVAALVCYLAALGHLGRVEEAALVLRHLLLIAPRFSIERFSATSAFERPQDRERVTAGLRLAGVAARAP